MVKIHSSIISNIGTYECNCVFTTAYKLKCNKYLWLVTWRAITVPLFLSSRLIALVSLCQLLLYERFLSFCRAFITLVECYTDR